MGQRLLQLPRTKPRLQKMTQLQLMMMLRPRKMAEAAAAAADGAEAPCTPLGPIHNNGDKGRPVIPGPTAGQRAPSRLRLSLQRQEQSEREHPPEPAVAQTAMRVVVLARLAAVLGVPSEVLRWDSADLPAQLLS